MAFHSINVIITRVWAIILSFESFFKRNVRVKIMNDLYEVDQIFAQKFFKAWVGSENTKNKLRLRKHPPFTKDIQLLWYKRSANNKKTQPISKQILHVYFFFISHSEKITMFCNCLFDPIPIKGYWWEKGWKPWIAKFAGLITRYS